MPTLGDQLFCVTLLTAGFFSVLQRCMNLMVFMLSEHQDLPWPDRFKKALPNTVNKYMIEFLPLIFLATAHIAVAVSATDSEYAGISVLLSIAALGQVGCQKRSEAGYKTGVEYAYRGILIVYAVAVMIVFSGLNFLRTEVSGLRLSAESRVLVDLAQIYEWRTIVASFVAVGFPVHWSGDFLWCVLGHIIKVTVTLAVLLAGRGEVKLVCTVPSYPCAYGRLLRWMWSPGSERGVMALLFVSTMAGDLSWRPKDKKSSESDSCSGSDIARAIDSA